MKIHKKKIANVTTDLRVFYTSDLDKEEGGQTNNDRIARKCHGNQRKHKHRQNYND